MSCLPLTNTALMTYDGNVSFFSENTYSNHVASTAVGGTNVAQGGNGARFEVTALDVRTLFTSTFPVVADDYVFVKMDIEGAEFAVLNRAIVLGLTPLWDQFFIEWHEGNPFIFKGSEKEAWARQQHACITQILESNGLLEGHWERRLSVAPLGHYLAMGLDELAP